MTYRISEPSRNVGLFTLALLACGTLAGCDSSSYSLTLPSFLSSSPSPPEQVRSETPRVTYSYRGDPESVQASQNAAAFCSQYQSQAHRLSATDELDGSTTAEFECVQGPIAAAPPTVQPSMTYLYRNDQELLNASHNAQLQCAPSGAPMSSTVTTDGNGNRSVTFTCGRG